MQETENKNKTVVVYPDDWEAISSWALEARTNRPTIIHELVEREKARREREAAGVKQA